MTIKQLVFDRSSEQYVDEHLVEAPGSVDFTNVRSWLVDRFGPVLNVARSITSEGEDIAIGWTFALPDGLNVEGPRDGFEIVMVPMLTDPETGEFISAFMWQAEEKARWLKLRSDGKVDKMTVDTVPEQPWKPAKPEE